MSSFLRFPKFGAHKKQKFPYRIANALISNPVPLVVPLMANYSHYTQCRHTNSEDSDYNSIPQEGDGVLEDYYMDHDDEELFNCDDSIRRCSFTTRMRILMPELFQPGDDFARESPYHLRQSNQRLPIVMVTKYADQLSDSYSNNLNLDSKDERDSNHNINPNLLTVPRTRDSLDPSHIQSSISSDRRFSAPITISVEPEHFTRKNKREIHGGKTEKQASSVSPIKFSKSKFPGTFITQGFKKQRKQAIVPAIPPEISKYLQEVRYSIQ